MMTSGGTSVDHSVKEAVLHAPPLAGLEQQLFSRGPYPRSVTEIAGHANTGKSIMAMHLVAKCILPKEISSKYTVGGCDRSAIFVDCLQHFSVFEVAAMLEGMVVAALRDQKCSREDVTHVLYKSKVVLKALKRLTVMKCYSFAEYILCCRRIGKALRKNRDIKLVAVDSLNAFNNEGSHVRRRQYRNLDRNLDYLTAETSDYAVTVIYTKSTLEYNRRQSYFDKQKKHWTAKDNAYYHLQEKRYGAYPRRVPLTARFFLFDDDKKRRMAVLTGNGPVWYFFSKSGRLQWL